MSTMTRTLPIAGIALVAGGFAILAAAGWSHLSQAPAPYGYHLVAEGRADSFSKLGLDKKPDLTVAKYEIRVDDVEKPLAEFHVARTDGDPLLLDWRNHTAEFIFTTDSSLTETGTVAEAIAKHAPKDALLLAWWDTSRKLRLLAGLDVLFDENLSRPLLIPSIWSGRDRTITALERGFWNVAEESRTSERFEAFADALTSDHAAGVAKLRRMAAARDAYLVLHVSDAIRLAMMAPDRLAIAYKDFSGSGQVHGQARRVKDWGKTQGYKAYAVIPVDEQIRRAVFLTDTQSTETLIARLLPFNTDNPFDVDGVSLVYQHGGYWVYRLAAPEAAAPTAAPTQ